MSMPIDSLSVLVLVDNETDGLSSPCSCSAERSSFVKYRSEFMPHFFQDNGNLDFSRLCYAGHGLSLLLTANRNGKSEVMFFDAGPSPDLFLHNTDALSVDQSEIGYIVLSHYHPDHSAGLRAAVPTIAKVRSSKGLPPPLVDLRAPVLEIRGLKTATGKVVPMTPSNPSVQELDKLGARFVMSSTSAGHSALDKMFFISGDIPRLTEYELGLAGHCTQQKDGSWNDDHLIMDERYVSVHMRCGGIVVFSACSHAGIVNVCRDALQKAGAGAYLMAVVGGFHLAGKGGEERIQRTVADLKELDPKVVIAGHCTGWRAKVALAEAFTGRYQPLFVGGLYSFKSN